MRQLIKKILREEREKDLSPIIKKLLENSLIDNYKRFICGFDVVHPTKREAIGSFTSFPDYQIIVYVLGGVGSKNWPQTQYVVRKRDEIVNDVWHTVNNFLGVNTDVFLRDVKRCDEDLDGHKQEQNESELTERCWKGYTQKGMKTMFGKRYPNCVKAKK